MSLLINDANVSCRNDTRYIKEHLFLRIYSRLKIVETVKTDTHENVILKKQIGTLVLEKKPH